MITDYVAGILTGVVVALIAITIYEYIEAYFNNRKR